MIYAAKAKLRNNKVRSQRCVRHPEKSRHRDQIDSSGEYVLEKKTLTTESCDLFAAGGVSAANSRLSWHLLPTHLGLVTDSFHGGPIFGEYVWD